MSSSVSGRRIILALTVFSLLGLTGCSEAVVGLIGLILFVGLPIWLISKLVSAFKIKSQKSGVTYVNAGLKV